MKNPSRVLSIAGSDSGGGAGIQADLKTFSSLGVYGSTAITAITAQNTQGVSDCLILDPSLVEAQIRAVLDDIGADVIKIGMLGNADVVAAVAQVLTEYPTIPVVLDPVMIAKSGAALLHPSAVDLVLDRLFPRAMLVTPNLLEAQSLLNRTVLTPEEMEQAGRDLLRFGPRAVLVKGGHRESEQCSDCLVVKHKDGSIACRWFESPRIATCNDHGTGCTLSAAIAGLLAQGRMLEDAVGKAKEFLTEVLKRSQRYSLGKGHGAACIVTAPS